MGEIIDFETSKKIKTEKTGREKFQEELRRGVPQVQHVQLAQSQRTSERTRDVENKATETRDSEASNTENQETRRKRRTIKNKPSKQKFNLQGKKKVIAIALAAALVGGIGYVGSQAYATFKTDNAPITLEQAEQSGKTAEDLKIDADTLQKIQELQERLSSDDIDIEELISIGNDTYNLQRDVIKSKLAAQLGVENDDIGIYSSYDKSQGDGSIEYIEVKGENQYNNRTIFESQLPDEIENYIKEVARTQTNITNVRNGTFDKKDIIKAYKEVIDETSQFAAGDLKIKYEVDENNKVVKDQNGNAKIKKITYDQTTQKELNTSKTTAKITERDDEER